MGTRQRTPGISRDDRLSDEGLSRLRPLTMAEIADELGIHETTVSRAIANKYMQTPRGVFEMKYFFSAGLDTDEGEEVAAKAAAFSAQHGRPPGLHVVLVGEDPGSVIYTRNKKKAAARRMAREQAQQRGANKDRPRAKQGK